MTTCITYAPSERIAGASRRPSLRLALGLAVALGAGLHGRTAHAQGIFLDSGESGFGAMGGVITNGDLTGLTIGAGYSHRALVDVGAMLSHYGFDHTGFMNLDATGLRGYVNVHLSLLGGTVSYEKLFYSADLPPGADVSIGGWDVFAGVFGRLPLELGRGFGAVPQATVGLQHNSMTVEAPVFLYTYEASSTWTSPVIRLDGNLTRKDSGNRVWSLDPMISLDKRNLTFGLFAGAVFR